MKHRNDAGKLEMLPNTVQVLASILLITVTESVHVRPTFGFLPVTDRHSFQKSVKSDLSHLDCTSCSQPQVDVNNKKGHCQVTSYRRNSVMPGWILFPSDFASRTSHFGIPMSAPFLVENSLRLSTFMECSVDTSHVMRQLGMGNW